MKRIFHIILGCLLIFQQSHSQGTWQSRASFPSGRNRAVAFSIDSFGYVGTGDTGYCVKDFWKYDPKSDTWTEIASMSTLGRLGAISFAINGKGYVGGGVNEKGGVDNEFWEYDSQLNCWSRKSNLPKYPYSFSTMASFAIGDKGYLFTSGYTDDFWEYNPQTDAWIPKAGFPGAGVMNQVGFSIGTKGFIGTGFTGGNNTKEFWEYDPAQDKWSKKADFPGTPRNSAVGFSIKNSGFIGLGVSFGGVFHSDFWEYHPETDSWTQIENCGIAAADAIAMNIGSKGYVGTGLWGLVDFWEYTPDLSSINSFEQPSEKKIYPNPVNDKLYFDIDYLGPITFSIYSILGQKVKTGAATDGSIPVADLPVGVYVLKIYSANKLFIREFLKE